MEQKNKLRLITALITANILFIWINSMLPGNESAKISGGLLLILQELFSFLGGMGEYLLRKLGHLAEFTCLGILLFRYRSLKNGYGFPAAAALLAGLLTACVDETIQIVSPGRASSLIDVWIDFGGILLGMMLLLLGQAIYRKSERKNRK